MTIPIIISMALIYLILKDICKTLDIGGLLRQQLHDKYDKRR